MTFPRMQGLPVSSLERHPVVFMFLQILSLSQATLGQFSAGHIINLASNDVQRFDPVS